MIGRAWGKAAIVLALAAAGCAAPRLGRVALPERRPLGGGLAAFEAPADDTAPRPEVEEPKGPLALREALALVLLHSPELAAASWDVRVAEAKMLQAGLRPNPELEFGIEGFGGTGEKGGFQAAEAGLQLSHLVELGGKRRRRVRAAAAEGRLAGWDYEAKRLDVLTAATKAFIEALAAQEQVALAGHLAALAEQALARVAERVRAGKVSPLEEHKARGEVARARIAHAQARHRAEAGRRRLAALWGSAEPAFDRLDGTLALDEARLKAGLPTPPQLAALLGQNPELDRWDDEMAQRRAALDLERANRIPDLSLSPGLGYFGETEDAAMLFGLALPLPFFDRNQGGILEARFTVAKAREGKRAAEAAARGELAEAYAALAAAFEEIKGIQAEVLPAVQAAYDAANAGFREGKFIFLDVLDAQRTLFEARGDLLAALTEYHKALADVERLIGQSIPQPAAGSPPAGGAPEEGSQP